MEASSLSKLLIPNPALISPIHHPHLYHATNAALLCPSSSSSSSSSGSSASLLSPTAAAAAVANRSLLLNEVTSSAAAAAATAIGMSSPPLIHPAAALFHWAKLLKMKEQQQQELGNQISHHHHHSQPQGFNPQQAAAAAVMHAMLSQQHHHQHPLLSPPLTAPSMPMTLAGNKLKSAFSPVANLKISSPASSSVPEMDVLKMHSPNPMEYAHSPRYMSHQNSQRENLGILAKHAVVKTVAASPTFKNPRLPLVPKYEDEDDDNQGLLDLSVKPSDKNAAALRASTAVRSPVARRLLVSPGGLLRSPVAALMNAEDLSPVGNRKRGSPIQTPDNQPIRKAMSLGKLNKSQVIN